MIALVSRGVALPLVTLVCLLLSGCDATEEEVVVMPEPLMSEPALEAPSASEPAIIQTLPPERSGLRVPRSGVVTAGDIDDTLNLSAFQRFQVRAAKRHGLPALGLQTPIRLALTGPNGQAAPGVSVSLRQPGAAEPFYEGVSGVDGRLLVFPKLHGGRPAPKVELRAFQDGREILRQTVPTGDTENRIALPVAGTWEPEFLDLVFVIDTSGSMGDEHDWLSREFISIMRAAEQAAPGLDIRYGLVAYQSPGDPYAVKTYGFTRRQSRMRSWIANLEAEGGAGGDEVVDRGLTEALKLPWRRGRGERLLFLVGDEPPAFRDVGTYLAAASEASRRNIQVFGLGASDTHGTLELLMRQAALITGGRYLFLTDDSGIGNAHAEPDIPCYRVTSLKSLLMRVLRSELSGTRTEAKPSDVIRTVGNYRNGVCRQ